jgi:hypothetical protein
MDACSTPPKNRSDTGWVAFRGPQIAAPSDEAQPPQHQRHGAKNKAGPRQKPEARFKPNHPRSSSLKNVR